MWLWWWIAWSWPASSAPSLTVCPGRRAVADGAEHLVAAQHQFHRATRPPRRHDAEDLRPLHQRLGAEAAAEEGRADEDVRGIDAEELCDAALAHGQRLAGRVDREPVAVPGRHDGVGLHGVVVLGGRLVGGLDALRRLGEAGLDVDAIVDVRRLADPDRGGVKVSLPSSPMRAGSTS